MKYRFALMIMISAIFCLALVSVSEAAYTQKQVYLDGSLVVDSNEGTTSGLSFINSNILVGAEGNTGYIYNEYLGVIDEFALYSGVLSSTRVAAHYSAQASGYSAYSTAVSADSPLLWMKFDDASVADSATAANSGSSATDGSYFNNGGTAMSQVTGIGGGADKALSIPDRVADAGGHAVVVPDDGEFGSDLDGSLTIEMWVKYSDITDYPRFYSHSGGTSAMISDTNAIGVSGGDGWIYPGLAYDINDNAWHHIVITYDSDYTADNNGVAGTYDEEIQADNPIAWVRFDNADDSLDATGNNWVTYGSLGSVVSGVGGVGNSFLNNASADGSGSFAAAVCKDPNGPPLVNESYAVYGDEWAFAPNDITIEFWYRSLPTGQPQPADYGMFFQQHGPYTNEPCAPAVSNASNQIRVFGGSGAGYTGVSPQFNGQWHHYVVTYDEHYNDEPNRMMVKVYLDGVWKDDTDFTAARSFLGPEMSHMVFGAANDYGFSYNRIPGYYDEIAIYEGILSPERIQAHYYAWYPHNCAELKAKGGEYLPAYDAADRNDDCRITLYDFAMFAWDWTFCNDPCDVGCTPNW